MKQEKTTINVNGVDTPIAEAIEISRQEAENIRPALKQYLVNKIICDFLSGVKIGELYTGFTFFDIVGVKDKCNEQEQKLINDYINFLIGKLCSYNE